MIIATKFGVDRLSSRPSTEIYLFQQFSLNPVNHLKAQLRLFGAHGRSLKL